MRMPSLNVLVVEDDAKFSSFIASALERHGHKINKATNSKQMIDLVLNNGTTIDLIVVDIGLPDGDGLSALKRITDTLGATIIPAIVITGNKAPIARDRALNQQVFNYLLKPVMEPEQVVSAVHVAWAKFKEFEAIKGKNESLQITLEQQKTIAIAKSKIMRQFGCNEDEAYRKIQHYAMSQKPKAIPIIRAAYEIIKDAEEKERA